jgi:hypothetical protein
MKGQEFMQEILSGVVGDTRLIASGAVHMQPGRMITSAQIRAARALLGITGVELAKRSGVSYATLQRAENAAGVPTMKTSNLFAITRALEQSGIVFIDADRDAGAGVRFRYP